MKTLPALNRKKVVVVHTLAKSYPEINGYTVRGHEILLAQNRLNDVDSIAITSPYYPGVNDSVEEQKIDDVRYIRTIDDRDRSDSGFGSSRKRKFLLRRIWSMAKYPFRVFFDYNNERNQMKLFQKRIEQVSISVNPDVIHAHTPFKVGLPSMRARSLGIPLCMKSEESGRNQL